MERASHHPAKEDICKLLQEDCVEQANALLAGVAGFSLSGANLRSANLQGLHAERIDFSNAYLRAANLKGVDLRSCNLEGASLHGAKIAGTYFPDSLTAEEILLSVTHGTRLRYRR